MKTPPKGDVDILKRYLKNADSKKRFLTFHILIPVFFLKFLAQASLGKKGLDAIFVGFLLWMIL